MTTNATETVKAYLASWSLVDPDERARSLAAVMESDATYVDPAGQAQGRDAFDAHIASIQSLFVGHHLGLASAVDEHNNVMRFEWELRDPNNEVTLTGTDFCTLSASGKLQSVTGFFGPTPPLDLV